MAKQVVAHRHLSMYLAWAVAALTGGIALILFTVVLLDNRFGGDLLDRTPSNWCCKRLNKAASNKHLADKRLGTGYPPQRAGSAAEPACRLAFWYFLTADFRVLRPRVALRVRLPTASRPTWSTKVS